MTRYTISEPRSIQGELELSYNAHMRETIVYIIDSLDRRAYHVLTIDTDLLLAIVRKMTAGKIVNTS